MSTRSTVSSTSSSKGSRSSGKRSDKERSDTSHHMVHSAKEHEGQSLEGLSDQEWESATTAKPAELLNVEKNPNAVTVFVGPKEIVEKPVIQKVIKESAPPVKKEKEDSIVQLVNRVANLITSGRDDAQAEVSVTVTVRATEPSTPNKKQETKETKVSKV